MFGDFGRSSEHSAVYILPEPTGLDLAIGRNRAHEVRFEVFSEWVLKSQGRRDL